MPAKYAPLAAYLAAQPAGVATVTLTLAELEAILGVPLSATARTASFWTNSRLRPTARAWLDAGWRVSARWLRRPEPAITFVRIPPDAPP